MHQVGYRQPHIEGGLYNFLPWFFVLHHKAGPEDFMPSYHLLQTLFQPGNIQVSLESPGHRDVVERIARIKSIKKPKLLLLIGKGKKRRSWGRSYQSAGYTFAALR